MTPSAPSRATIPWLTALGVTFSSAAASLKLAAGRRLRRSEGREGAAGEAASSISEAVRYRHENDIVRSRPEDTVPWMGGTSPRRMCFARPAGAHYGKQRYRSAARDPAGATDKIDATGQGVMETIEKAALTADGLQALLDALAARGYRVVGPTVRDQAIVYDDIASLADLPRGLDRRAGRRPLPPGRARRRRAVRLCGRAAFLEAVPASADAAPVAGRRATATTSQVDAGADGRRRASPSSACAPASCTPSPSRTGCFLGGALCRSALPRAARGRLHRRGQLRQGRRHLLLRLDGHRAEGRRPASTSR